MNARNVGIEVDVIIDVNTSVFAFLNVRRVFNKLCIGNG